MYLQQNNNTLRGGTWIWQRGGKLMNVKRKNSWSSWSWAGVGAITIYVLDEEAFKAYMNAFREHPDWVLLPSIQCFIY